MGHLRSAQRDNWDTHGAEDYLSSQMSQVTRTHRGAGHIHQSMASLLSRAISECTTLAEHR